MTTGDSVEKRISTAKRACIVAFCVLCGCAAAGEIVFRMLGITLPALKIAGGLLLLFVAMDMVNARQSRTKGSEEETQEGAMKDDVAIFPLGIPLLSGPGSIVTVFILMERTQSYVDHAFIYASILLTMVLSFLMMRQANWLARLLGQTGINVFSRLMGIVLAAIAMQFILDGAGRGPAGPQTLEIEIEIRRSRRSC